MAITIENGTVFIDGLETNDPAVLGLVNGVPEARSPEELVLSALSIGARGLMSMGMGLRVEDMEARVRSAIATGASEATRQIADTIAAARHALEQEIDPDRSGSHSSRLLEQLAELVAPDGLLLSGIKAILDPSGDSPIARANLALRDAVADLGDRISYERGRTEEANRGTAKGVEFEDRLDLTIRELARPLSAIVERTSRTPGQLGAASVVGDHLFIVPGSLSIVIESKNQRSIAVGGKGGILHELDRAMANRDAQAAICVSAVPAYPDEVGHLAVYGNKVLVVDDGDGTMLLAAIRLLLAGDSVSDHEGIVDLRPIHDGLTRLKTIGQKFSNQRSALTDVGKSLDRVSEGLADMREEVLTLVDDLIRHLRSDDRVIDLHRHAG
jgi:hypothetical protein